ncbi:MAG: hypothetical protein O3A46_02420 [Candidatus Poribacteria bacterium]|nr:hypothetical protein [Candidatus Poribacteria bacterium]
MNGDKTACVPFRYDGFSDDVSARLTEWLASHDVQVAGDIGTISKLGVIARYEVDRPARTLTLTILKKPLAMPCRLIDGTIRKKLESLGLPR